MFEVVGYMYMACACLYMLAIYRLKMKIPCGMPHVSSSFLFDRYALSVLNKRKACQNHSISNVWSHRPDQAQTPHHHPLCSIRKLNGSILISLFHVRVLIIKNMVLPSSPTHQLSSRFLSIRVCVSSGAICVYVVLLCMCLRVCL